MIHRETLRRQARAWGLTLTRDHTGTYRLHPRGKRDGRAAEGVGLKDTMRQASELWSQRHHQGEQRT